MKLTRFFADYRSRAFLTLGVLLSLAAFGVNTGLTSASQKSNAKSSALAGGRTMRVVSTNASAGSPVTVSIELDSEGDEVAASFTVNFDQTKLSTPSVTIGSGAPGGSALTINPNQTGIGRLGLLQDSNLSFAAGPGRQIVSVRFDVAAGAPNGPTPITFGNTPTPRSTSSPLGELLPTAYEDGTVTIAPAAAGFQVSGRVTTPAGQGLRNAIVAITSLGGVRRIVNTSSFGFYSFDDVAGGQTHTLSVTSRRYRFSSRVVTVNENLVDIDFAAQE